MSESKVNIIFESYSNTYLEEILYREIPTGWEEFFNSKEIKTIISSISKQLYELGQHEIIYPEISNIFKAFELVPLDKIKVIINGQDPYFNGAATGLAFSIPKGLEPNPSLKNTAREVKECGFKIDEKCGDLTQWAKQGIFLINTALTVRKGEADSHRKVWPEFTKALIKYITEKRKDIVFLLWGDKAKLYKKYFSNKEIPCVETSHPSPLGAYRGFIGSRCFNKVNDELIKLKLEPINWNILPDRIQ